ncbi:MAG: AAA family ATPase [Mycobacteriaceae bacterium]|nr:AAA family ATPase [Mycobacteriaceae bacterium]
MNLRTFARTLATHWTLFVGAFVACLAGTVFLTAVQTKIYQSSATVLISFPGETNLSDVWYGTQAVQDRLSSYSALAGGPAVAERAISRFNLPISVDALVKQTRVQYTPKSTLFKVSVIDTDPKRAEVLTKAMADQFVAMIGTLDANPRGAAPPPGTDEQPAPHHQLDTQPGPAQPSARPWLAVKATVVEQPSVSHHPISPVPLRNMAIGVVAGLLLGTAVVLAREATDHTVRNREKLEQISGLPNLAELPGRRGTALRFGADVQFDEAIRSLRTRVLRAIGPGASRIALTAPFGGEGTTTTAVNLARACAEIGEHVLIVEGDTRRPVIASLLNVQSGEGLANVLANPDEAAEAAKPTPIPGLSVLAARTSRSETPPCSAYPPEVLDKALLESSVIYDRTLVDTPPVLATADSDLLAGAVHATVVVVRARRTTEDELTDALSALRAAGARVVGTVLTDARIARTAKASARAYWAKIGKPV